MNYPFKSVFSKLEVGKLGKLPMGFHPVTNWQNRIHDNADIWTHLSHLKQKKILFFIFTSIKILHTVLCSCILVRAEKLSITLYVLACFMYSTAHPALADLVFYGFCVLIFLFRFKVHRELFHPASVNTAVVYFHYE